MLNLYPAFYKEFHCLASACPDNCCVGWEVVVDDGAAAYYESLHTPLGRALRDAMTVDADGDRILRMENGHCPFWTADHLCRVELELGPQAPCATCRKFPRLTQDYTVFTEHGLTLACPEAARLILTQPGPWAWESEGRPGDPEEADLDWEFLQALGVVRRELLETVWRQDLTASQALTLCLARGRRFQRTLCGADPGPWEEEKLLRPPGAPGDCRPLLALHRNLELLTPAWGELLEEALAWEAPTPSLPDTVELRNLMSYYLYRYWLQAVADYDCEMKLRLLAVNWAVVRRLQEVRLAKTGSLSRETRLRFFQLYAKEVEHDAVNRAALEDALDSGEFSWESLLRLI